MNQPTQHIQNLIARFLRKEATDKDLLELQQWLNEEREHLQYFDKANEDFQATTTLRQFTPKKITQSWQQLETRIKNEKIRHLKTDSIFSPYGKILRIAASFSILAIALLGIWKFTLNQNLGDTSELTVVYNSKKRNSHLILPDSTSVWLNANSSVEYAADFNQKREVLLKGEAFFDVKKKQKQNFIVKTSYLSIQVKGTRFNVQAYGLDNENATLEEGAIELTINGEPQTYSMIPGDQITINKTAQTVIRKKVNPTNFTAWKEDKIVFDNAPLKDIILKLENRYHVHITIDDKIAQRERLSMTIENEPIEDILEMIQLSSDLNYKIEKETILIYE
jgi:transmembrane sensor